MKLIDVHAHLESSRFEKDLPKVLERFKKAGGEFVINSGVNPQTNRRVLELSKKYDLIRPSFGLYPTDALAKEVESSEGDFLRDVEAFDVDEELAWIEEHKDECVAIGEVGLDYNWPDFAAHKEKQIEVFEKVIALALKINKPIIVHSRKAEVDAVEILERHCRRGDESQKSRPNFACAQPTLIANASHSKSCDSVKGLKQRELKVVMHCFSGKRSLIKRGVENGWYFSVPPVITRLEHFKMLVENVPLTQILTETDAPYLSSVAGTRNEPANVAVTIKEIAKIKGLSEEEVSSQIFENAKEVFEIDDS